MISRSAFVGFLEEIEFPDDEIETHFRLIFSPSSKQVLNAHLKVEKLPDLKSAREKVPKVVPEKLKYLDFIKNYTILKVDSVDWLMK